MARIDGKEREQWQAALDKERKRADVLEEKLTFSEDGWLHNVERAEKAEAKLAGAEKQLRECQMEKKQCSTAEENIKRLLDELCDAGIKFEELDDSGIYAIHNTALNQEKEHTGELEAKLEVERMEWSRCNARKLRAETKLNQVTLNLVKAEEKLDKIKEVLMEEPYPKDVFVSKDYDYTRTGRGNLVRDITKILEDGQ